jgi:hypothetical protein
MPNKYSTHQSDESPDNRPLKPIEQSTRDEEIQYQRERAAENNGAANDLLTGGMIAALLGLAGVATYFYFGKQPSIAPTTTISTPPTSSSAASASSVPEKQTKIIERTIERAAPPQVIQVHFNSPKL